MRVTLTTEEVCVCPKPDFMIDREGWVNWVRTHWQDCRPRKIENVYLPGDADE